MWGFFFIGACGRIQCNCKQWQTIIAYMCLSELSESSTSRDANKRPVLLYVNVCDASQSSRPLDICRFKDLERCFDDNKIEFMDREDARFGWRVEEAIFVKLWRHLFPNDVLTSLSWHPHLQNSLHGFLCDSNRSLVDSRVTKRVTSPKGANDSQRDERQFTARHWLRAEEATWMSIQV